MSEPVSVVIIAYNEAVRLSACLRSVKFADEIVLVDSGSTDGTVELAESQGCRVVRQTWLGFGRQKQFAVQQASHDWVLCLDADERVSAELRTNILKLLAQPPLRKAYRMPRCNYFMGRWLRHGEGYPDPVLRLFDRRYAAWSDDPVHEKVLTAMPLGELNGDLLHESQDTLDHYLTKQNRYTTLQAERLHQQSVTVSAAKIIFSPAFRFIKMYVFRLGFLDGMPGLIHILIGCWNSAMKYAKLYSLSRDY